MNDNCNCSCDFYDNSDYNRFGDVGYYMPLAYQIYYNGKNKVKDIIPGKDDVWVENRTLIFSDIYQTVKVEENTLVLVNDEVRVEGTTLILN